LKLARVFHYAYLIIFFITPPFENVLFGRPFPNSALKLTQPPQKNLYLTLSFLVVQPSLPIQRPEMKRFTLDIYFDT